MSQFTDAFKYEWVNTEGLGRVILVFGVMLGFIIQPRVHIKMMMTKSKNVQK